MCVESLKQSNAARRKAHFSAGGTPQTWRGSAKTLDQARSKATSGMSKYREPKNGELWVVKRQLWLVGDLDPGDIITIINVEPKEQAAAVWRREVKILFDGKLRSVTTRELGLLTRNGDIEPIEENCKSEESVVQS